MISLGGSERYDQLLTPGFSVTRVTAGSRPQALSKRRLQAGKGGRVSRVSVSECAQCGANMIAPERCEHVSDHCIRNFWSCACGYRLEDTVYFSAGGRRYDSLRLRNSEGRIHVWESC